MPTRKKKTTRKATNRKAPDERRRSKGAPYAMNQASSLAMSFIVGNERSVKDKLLHDFGDARELVEKTAAFIRDEQGDVEAREFLDVMKPRKPSELVSDWRVGFRANVLGELLRLPNDALTKTAGKVFDLLERKEGLRAAESFGAELLKARDTKAEVYDLSGHAGNGKGALIGDYSDGADGYARELGYADWQEAVASGDYDDSDIQVHWP